MGLLPTVNEPETVQTVKTYLAEKFPKLIMMAGFSMVDLKSPRFSTTPIISNTDNSTEYNAINRLDASQLVNDTIDAIKRCTGIYQKILWLTYVQELSETRILEQVPYERSQYYKIEIKALLCFADSFMGTYDLHTYVTDGDATCIN